MVGNLFAGETKVDQMTKYEANFTLTKDCYTFMSTDFEK